MIFRLFVIAAVTVIGITTSGHANADEDADVGKGKTVFNKCRACHSALPQKNGVGPSLFGIVGRKAGSEAGYKRYKGLKKADWVWNETALDAFLTNPRKFTKARTGANSSMVLKIKKARDRRNLIEYLETLK